MQDIRLDLLQQLAGVLCPKPVFQNWGIVAGGPVVYGHPGPRLALGVIGDQPHLMSMALEPTYPAPRVSAIRMGDEANSHAINPKLSAAGINNGFS